MKDTTVSNTVGILGAGQLGRMLALAGYPLGLSFRFYDTSREVCAGDLAPVTTGRFDDTDNLRQFAKSLNVATAEFENVPASALQEVAQIVPCFPAPQAFALSQDRLLEKQLFQSLRIPTPTFSDIVSKEALGAALKSVGLPSVIKTRRFGYDGKGQIVVRSPEEAAAAFDQLAPAPLLLESFVNFDHECSLIAVRSKTGDLRCYPLVQNIHRRGILRFSSPDPEHPLQSLAEAHAKQILEHFHYVGVLAVEFFVAQGQLIANEMAPRVHNSGHWTIDGAETSQFENHLRAITGLPLGSTRTTTPAVMLNIIGNAPERRALLGVADSHLHLYNKAPRDGRKIGHLTLRHREWTALTDRVRQAAGLLNLGDVAEEFLSRRDEHGRRTAA